MSKEAMIHDQAVTQVNQAFPKEQYIKLSRVAEFLDMDRGSVVALAQDRFLKLVEMKGKKITRESLISYLTMVNQ